MVFLKLWFVYLTGRRLLRDAHKWRATIYVFNHMNIEDNLPFTPTPNSKYITSAPAQYGQHDSFDSAPNTPSSSSAPTPPHIGTSYMHPRARLSSPPSDDSHSDNMDIWTLLPCSICPGSHSQWHDHKASSWADSRPWSALYLRDTRKYCENGIDWVMGFRRVIRFVWSTLCVFLSWLIAF